MADQMTPTETIAAAIQRLSELRAEAEYSIVNGWLIEETGSGTTYVDGASLPLGDERTPLTNDPLIVTLYSSLEPQLAILKNELEDSSTEHRPCYDDIYRLALSIVDPTA